MRSKARVSREEGFWGAGTVFTNITITFFQMVGILYKSELFCVNLHIYDLHLFWQF